ncbi:MAG: RDD family protein, partial [Ktedonobacteraceae bacterium]
GATLGKMVVGLRVVKLDGSPISWSESVIRNLLRIIDGIFFYLVGAIFVWTSPRKQRLGDRAASTVVIRRRA